MAPQELTELIRPPIVSRLRRDPPGEFVVRQLAVDGSDRCRIHANLLLRTDQPWMTTPLTIATSSRIQPMQAR